MLEVQLGLKTHRETRAFPAYALVVAESSGRLGPSLKSSVADCFDATAGAQPTPALAALEPERKELKKQIDSRRQQHVTRRFCGIDNNFFGLTGAGVRITELASEFHRSQYPIAPDLEVVDRTGLTGTYDFELRFGVLPLAAIGHANPALGTVLSPLGIRSVYTALPEQLGLKLVKTTVSREVLVIDQINRPK
jgi:uncharacterized protein (TIGR03435 family)